MILGAGIPGVSLGSSGAASSCQGWGERMTHIQVITLTLPMRLASVNCYLVHTEDGCILIDTGCANARAALEKALAEAGCGPGDLSLIVLTNGDFDHTSNAAYLRDKFGAKLAMHPDDWPMLESGDTLSARQSPCWLLRALSPCLFGCGLGHRATPDLALGEGYDLSVHGLDARVVSIPGHSRGSIGILTGDGDLFCGDLMENTAGPALNTIMEDPLAAEASMEKLNILKIGTVYPGHGAPFPMAQYVVP